MVSASFSKYWLHSIVLALGTFLSTAAVQAQTKRELVRSDARMVAFEEEVEEAEFAQVGFLKHRHGRSSCSALSCDGCGEATVSCCCSPWWAHRSGGFGQFLLLRPGNVDHIYSIEENSPIPGDFPTGPVGRVNVDQEAGFRVGFAYAASDCTSLVTSFTRFEGNTSHTINASAGNVLNSQIIHPSTLTVGAASLQSSANYSIDFQLIDLAYRHIWKVSDHQAINWLAGFRYGNMEQGLLTQQEVSVATGLVRNDVDVDFNGFGMMFGVDAERHSSKSGLMIYGRALTSFLAGDWRGEYRQTNQFGGGVVANDYEDYRVTPVLELELGLGWQSKCGKWRGTVGYLTSAWYDAISTRQYVDAVRANDYSSIDETITFSGLTAQIERRF